MQQYTRGNPVLAYKGGSDRSAAYWRGEARRIFEQMPRINRVIISRRKSDLISAGEIQRGAQVPTQPGTYLIIPSTGGKYGKSRQDFCARRDAI